MTRNAKEEEGKEEAGKEEAEEEEAGKEEAEKEEAGNDEERISTCVINPRVRGTESVKCPCAF